MRGLQQRLIFLLGDQYAILTIGARNEYGFVSSLSEELVQALAKL